MDETQVEFVGAAQRDRLFPRYPMVRVRRYINGAVAGHSARFARLSELGIDPIGERMLDPAGEEQDVSCL